MPEFRRRSGTDSRTTLPLIGSDRSKLINEFIGWIRRDAPLWRDARTVAAARGELLGSVITRAMRAYVSRNKDLLDE